MATLNYCCPGNPSWCELAARKPEHHRCRFYGRSPSRDECLWHYDAMCTCAAAQVDARKEKENHEAIA